MIPHWALWRPRSRVILCFEVDLELVVVDRGTASLAVVDRVELVQGPKRRQQLHPRLLGGCEGVTDGGTEGVTSAAEGSAVLASDGAGRGRSSNIG